MSSPDLHYTLSLLNHHTGQRLELELLDLPFPSRSYRSAIGITNSCEFYPVDAAAKIRAGAPVYEPRCRQRRRQLQRRPGFYTSAEAICGDSRSKTKSHAMKRIMILASILAAAATTFLSSCATEEPVPTATTTTTTTHETVTQPTQTTTTRQTTMGGY